MRRLAPSLPCLMVLAFALSTAACVKQPIPPAPNQAVFWRLYNDAIADAAVIEPDEIRTVGAIAGDRVVVATWTSFDYQLGSTELGVDVWVTLVPEVRERCRGYGGYLDMRLRQMLGLPPDDRKTQFVEMRIQAKDLFRPCADPDIAADRCGAEIPDSAPEAHRDWFAQNSANSYKTPGGYPWTRLGYTYDWNPDALEFGPAEYVARKGARVEVISITPTKEYCR